MQEKIVETKLCKHCNLKFEITDKDLEFYEKVSPKFNGEFFQIPTPTLCPDCRQQRRLSFRNERKLYKRKCDATGKDIISMYSPDKHYKVYNQDFWWSDKWDSMDYGMNFDFNRGFFEQFDELMKEVPLQNLNNKLLENSHYVNDCISCKGCYLTFNSIHSEDSMYSYILRNGVDCVDTDFCDKCFNSYNLIECGGNSHYLFYSAKSSKCLNSYFLFNCSKCENCICCSNLVDKKYYIFNEKYSLKDYEKKKNELFEKGFSSLINEYKKLVNKSFTRHMFGYSNENVFGDNIFYSKNCNECYDSNHLEDCKYIYTAMETKNSQDIYLFGNNLELSYDSVFVGENSYKIIFSYGCSVNCYNLLYCYNLTGSSNCFGCIGLRNKSYCILNKQYTKEDYEELVPKIIEHMIKWGEWGEFFPSSISPFGYNETVAMEYFPINPPVINEIPLNKGGNLNGVEVGGLFNWSTYETPFPKVDKIIPASKLPDNINEIPDDILNRAVECDITKKPFRIIKQELDFYRKYNLPIPHLHPDQRYLERMKLRNPRKLFDRKCNKCGVDIKTTYNPDREKIVYCEDCYNKEVY